MIAKGIKALEGRDDPHYARMLAALKASLDTLYRTKAHRCSYTAIPRSDVNECGQVARHIDEETGWADLRAGVGVDL